jgi:hypothetical protein
MKNLKLISLTALFIVAMTTSCVKDLDVTPLDPNLVTSATVYDSPGAYIQGLAKLYASYSVSGQQGPSGKPDIAGIDEGFSNYLRQYWNAQELSTDEAVMAWNDATIKDFHWQTWTPNDVFITAIYGRIFFTIAIANEYIRATAGNTDANIAQYNAEARFIRALSYYHAIDLFGNTPFITEANLPGAFFPEQTTRIDLFNYIESELKDIEGSLGAPRFEYGRADQAAAWTLLAKLYLNSKVYTGTERTTECITYCNKVINAGYSLSPGYTDNFVADNNTSPEMIFPITCDGAFTRSYGGMTYLIHAAIGGSMPPAEFGVGGGWGGIRTTSAFVNKFSTGKSFWSSPKPKQKADAYPVIYVPGSYQTPTAWDPSNTTTVLASVLSDGNYEGYLYFPAGAQFKFTAGPNWDVNWGDTGADGTLEPGGDNLTVAEAGYYKMNVNVNALTYTILKTTWGVIGDATAGGWDSDQNMNYDEATGLWTTTLDLKAGSLKFRANDGWDLNYGDTGFNGILESGGDNIAIPEAGTYAFTMKLGYPDYTYTIVRKSYDHRALFYTAGQSLEIEDIAQFTQGYAITKFRNVTKDGSPAPHAHPDFVDTDFPMFRLADVYLMYAEAVLRGGQGGDNGTALDLVNQIRERSYGDAGGNIDASGLTLSFILDERARELYWEGHRRTDLIRFGQFTDGAYVWPWKGNAAEGVATASYRNLYPIPSSDLGANPNLKQNTGY